MAEIANLEKIDLKLLTDGDEKESAKLFQAAQSVGLFYLNLANHPEYSKTLELLSDIYGVAKVYFDQDEAAKQQDFRLSQQPWSDRG